MKKENLTVIAVIAVLAVGGIIFALSGNAGKNNNLNNIPASSEQNAGENMPEKGEAMNNNTIVDIAVKDGRFTTLVKAVTEGGLVETLSGQGPFTVFAPTDEAFAKLPAGTIDSLLKDKNALVKVLTYHVVPGKVMAADVVNLTSAKTVQGQDVTVKAENNKVMINGSNVIIADIEASNGVIHVIDSVLLPE